jgi:hypothetical protein
VVVCGASALRRLAGGTCSVMTSTIFTSIDPEAVNADAVTDAKELENKSESLLACTVACSVCLTML